MTLNDLCWLFVHLHDSSATGLGYDWEIIVSDHTAIPVGTQRFSNLKLGFGSFATFAVLKTEAT